MAITYRIELNDLDFGQLRDGLKTRTQSWEGTANYLHGEATSEDEFFLFEECSKPEKADDIVNHFLLIFRAQMEIQR